MGNVLSQYADLVKEQKDLAERIASTQRNIENIERRLQKIEAGEVVKDKVYGGEGGEETLAMVYEALRHEGIPGVEIAEMVFRRLDSEVTFEKVLEDAGVFKRDDAGRAAFRALPTREISAVSRRPRISL